MVMMKITMITIIFDRNLGSGYMKRMMMMMMMMFMMLMISMVMVLRMMLNMIEKMM